MASKILFLVLVLFWLGGGSLYGVSMDSLGEESVVEIVESDSYLLNLNRGALHLTLHPGDYLQ